jgi:hypothetical protein
MGSRLVIDLATTLRQLRWPAIFGMQDAPSPTKPEIEVQEVRLWALLVGILVIGGSLFLFVHVVSRYMRRQLRKSRGRSRQGPDNWAARRLLKVPQPETPGDNDSHESPSNDQ